MRRISKADDYDIQVRFFFAHAHVHFELINLCLLQTRTLCKFLMEVALLDARFLRAKPSMIAAIGMYLARKMLGGEWVRSTKTKSLIACKPYD